MRLEGGSPRVFYLPPGVDFAAELARGLRARAATPEDLARLRLYLNTRRTARRVEAALEAAGASYLPRVSLVSSLEAEAARAGLRGWDGRLRRTFALIRLTEAFLKAQPDLGPVSSAPALALSLQRLLDELQAAGVPAEAVRKLDLGEHSRHWALTVRFLGIVAEQWPAHLAEAEGGALDPEARRVAAAAAEIADWALRDPGPVVAAGSTGSTPATARLLAAVARLPQGAVVLPGWDPEMPGDVWAALAEGEAPEHPQHALAQVVAGLGLTPAEVRPWTEAAAPSRPRLRLLAEALRPAPVTDAWAGAMAELSAWAEAASAASAPSVAESPRAEAAAIAAALACAAAAPEGTAALVTPDATLARRVAAELARWGLIADESGGRPLGLTPPGVLLGLLAGAVGRPMTAAGLAALLRHPLAGGREGRAAHGRFTRWLERRALRGGPAEVEWDRLRGTLTAAEARRLRDGRSGAPEGFDGWFDWVRATLAPLAAASGDAADCAGLHLEAAEALSGGLGGEAPPLWDEAAGEAARDFARRFREAAESAPGALGAAAYPALWAAMIGAEEARRAAQTVSDRIRILGTLEARAERADLMVLAGLNEGTWPAHPAPDPWLNRDLRRGLGLAPPERRTGLAAHDFLVAANAPRVILSRAARDDGGPTVASRWLARLTTLLEGAAPARLAEMRARGEGWLRAARGLDDGLRLEPAERPRPCPPVAARPRKLSVTQVETLIRDPYAIYAREVLRLKKLDPLGRPPDARDRGTLLHGVMERFAEATRDWPVERATPEALEAALREAAEAVLAGAPWAAQRRLWLKRLERAAPWFAAREAERRAVGRIEALEASGERVLAAPGGAFRLTARADRIDRLRDGRLAIYDYKTGAPPSERQIGAFSKQLLFEAAIAAAGGFEGVPGAEVAGLEYVGLSGAGEGGDARRVDLDKHDPAEHWARLGELIAAYDEPSRPYPPRARPQFLSFEGDYDHLARYGEWTDAGGEEGE